MKQKTNTNKRVLAVTAVCALALATVAGVVKFGAVTEAAKGIIDNKAEYGEQLKDHTPQSLNLTELSGSADIWFWVDPEDTYFGRATGQKFVVRNAATDAAATAYREVTVPVQQRSVTPVVKYGAISGTPANYVSSGIASINTYKRTVSVSSGGNGTVSGSGDYVIGQTATIEATPTDGYHFVQWNDEGSGNTDNPRTVTVKSGANEYSAIFEQDADESIRVTSELPQNVGDVSIMTIKEVYAALDGSNSLNSSSANESTRYDPNYIKGNNANNFNNTKYHVYAISDIEEIDNVKYTLSSSENLLKIGDWFKECNKPTGTYTKWDVEGFKIIGGPFNCIYYMAYSGGSWRFAWTYNSSGYFHYQTDSSMMPVTDGDTIYVAIVRSK